MVVVWMDSAGEIAESPHAKKVRSGPDPRPRKLPSTKKHVAGYTNLGDPRLF